MYCNHCATGYFVVMSWNVGRNNQGFIMSFSIFLLVTLWFLKAYKGQKKKDK